MNITFIGGGNMAAALIGGLLAKGFEARQIRVVEVLPEARERLKTYYGVECFAEAALAGPMGDVLVLAVKPQHMRSVAQNLAPYIKGSLVLSIAAGIRLPDLSRWLGGTTHLARCMPNTPALIGLGISGAYAAPAVSAAQREQVKTILEAVGRVVWVDEEELLDPVTAISGSGPAYVFYFIEAMQRAAESLGLPIDTARALIIDTLRGATELAARSEEPVHKLRERVTSKGGTTEAALICMKEKGVGDAIMRAVKAASARATALGDELGRD
ncbi:MAG TPA: pyrroline-5-carboxylate reductase [Burkholderiales bacterium]|jgi:pyrroline-5-carboxylate reductase|nr:pyrroline-5-carboxylate reductase [Burkholderiales bacterium]